MGSSWNSARTRATKEHERTGSSYLAGQAALRHTWLSLPSSKSECRNKQALLMFESILTTQQRARHPGRQNQKITLSFQYDRADTRLSRGHHTGRHRCNMPSPRTAFAIDFERSQRLLLLPPYVQPFILGMFCSCNLRNIAAYTCNLLF